MRYAVANNARTKLTAPLSITDNFIHVQSTESFPESEYPYLVTINNEILEVKPATLVTFEVLNRGCEGTTPADHPAGSVVENRFTAGTYQALVDNIMDASRSALWTEITGKPSTFTPSPHNHTWSEVINKPGTFTPSAHNHTWSEVTNKPSTFTPSAHTHTSEQITDFWDFWIGVPIPWYQETPPPGFIELNGAAISRTTYSKLFARYGTRFGAGNGYTTFNLPDLRGEFIRGWDNGRGVDPGRQLGSWQSDEFKEHSHKANTASWSNQDIVKVALGTADLKRDWRSGYIEATGGPETRPRNVAFMYITKY